MQQLSCYLKYKASANDYVLFDPKHVWGNSLTVYQKNNKCKRSWRNFPKWNGTGAHKTSFVAVKKQNVSAQGIMPKKL